MASCSYSTLVGGLCGSSLNNLENIECVTIGACTKNIQMHLKMYGVSDSLLNSEAKLLLARAVKDVNFILCGFWYVLNAYLAFY